MPEPKSLEDLLKSGALKKGNDPSLDIHRLPIGIPAFDNMLGGGLPLGKCVQLYGPESTGKTLVAQYAVKAVQKSQYPLCILLDMERSYDKAWWKQSGVDTEELLVSTPTTAEEAIDVMRAVAQDPMLGMIVIDSVAAMIPKPEMDPERTTEDNHAQPGGQAKVITRMYHQLVPLLDNRIIFLSTNQMRDNIGGYDELSALPGGRANRHYNHIILRTKRDSWITDSNNKDKLGFYMDITSRKNKLAVTHDGANILLPFMFDTQIDWTTMYIEEGIKQGFIVKKAPYYHVSGQSIMGMQKLRQYFVDHPEELEIIKTNLGL